MHVLADRLALGHRRDHRLAEVLRVRAREADPLDPVDRVAGAQQLAELRAQVGREVAAPRVHVLAEQRDLPHALAGEPRDLGDDLARPAADCSRPRTEGTMQYAHFELQPIETCTQAWKRRSRCIGSCGGERALLGDAEAAARDALAARAEPVAEVRDRAGAERDVDERVELEDPLALRLGVAAADGDHALRVVAASARRALPRCAARRVSGFSRIVQVLKTSTSASSWRRRLAEPELLEQALDPLRVVGVHLAAERRDVVPLHGS